MGTEGNMENENIGRQLQDLTKTCVRSGIYYTEGVKAFKKNFIVQVLADNKGNQCRAARELGMHRNTLSRTIQELKIDLREIPGSSRHAKANAKSFVRSRKPVGSSGVRNYSILKGA